MKPLFVLLVFAVTACGALEAGLRVKFGIGLRPGTDFFYKVGRTVAEATADNWTLLERPPGPLPELVMYCPPERHLCTIYDDTDFIAGVQIAIPQDEVTDALLDWDTQGYTEWTPPAADGEDSKTYWTIQQYFVSEETLNKTTEERLQSRDSSKTLQEGGVWVTGVHHDLVKIASTTDEIKQSAFTRQSCIPTMGRHYYYNMSEELDCTSESLFPWFAMVYSGDLVATGFVTFAKLPIKKGRRDWFERPPALLTKVFVPRGPPCLNDISRKPGLVNMHVYYVDKPWQIGCLPQ